MNKIVECITLNVDYDEDNETSINVCWLKFPYISLYSNAPYFHYTTKKEFNKLVKEYRVINEDELEDIDILSGYKDFNLFSDDYAKQKAKEKLKEFWESEE